MRLAVPEAGEPRGWYEEFVDRCWAYLETLARPQGSGPGVVSLEHVARIRPRVLVTGLAQPGDAAPEPQVGLLRPREPQAAVEEQVHAQKRPRALAPSLQ